MTEHHGKATARAGPYTVINGAIHHEKPTPKGPIAIPLCNFDARIVSEEIRDVGAKQTIVISIEGTLQDGTSLPRTEVSAERYASMGWITPSWGSRAIVNAGRATKDHLRAAITLISEQRSPFLQNLQKRNPSQR